MKKYKFFACPKYNESLSVIVTDIDTVEVLNAVLKSFDLFEKYDIKSEPSSNIIEIINSYKQLKIIWLNTLTSKLEEDIFILGINTATRPFLYVLNSFIGIPFDVKEFTDCIVDNHQKEFIKLFARELSSAVFLEDIVKQEILFNFNKTNHYLFSTKVTNIKNRTTTLYNHYET